MDEESLSRRLFLRRAGQAFGVVALLPLIGSEGPLVAKGKHEEYFEHTILAMGTTARLGVYARTEKEANTIITPIFNELKRLESLFTVYEDSSDIGKINLANGAPVVVSPDTLKIIESSVHFATLTDGAFDITVEPLMRLWGFRNETPQLDRLPTHEEIDAILPHIGSQQIELDMHAITVRLISPLAKLDLGGIAVGYSLDRMWQMLMRAGVKNAFLDISGDIIALGNRHGEHGWNIGIPDPGQPSRIIHDLSISNQALATSGSYMNYVVYQAEKFGHIMDPHKGRSADMKITSTTAISPTGIEADALSTAAFVNGHNYPNQRLIAVLNSGQVRETSIAECVAPREI